MSAPRVQRLHHAAAGLRWALPGLPALLGAALVLRRRSRAGDEEVARRLASADRVKADFVATVSHELRTPLTSIIGYAELLLSDTASDLPPVHLQVLGRIERNARRLSGLVEDLLLMAQVEDGRLLLTRSPIDLRQPARAAVAATRGAHDTKELTLHLALAEEPVSVLGDAERLERAVTHLLVNAVTFSHVGETVELRLLVEQGQAVLQVVDTGVGMPPEEQRRLGERFFRGAEAQDRVVQGAGLGLAVTRAVTDAHEGTLEVQSTPGSGSVFTIRLPLLPPAPPHEGRLDRT